MNNQTSMEALDQDYQPGEPIKAKVEFTHYDRKLIGAIASNIFAEEAYDEAIKTGFDPGKEEHGHMRAIAMHMSKNPERMLEIINKAAQEHADKLVKLAMQESK